MLNNFITGDLLPIHRGRLCTVMHKARWDSLVMLFRNQRSHRLHPFHPVGRNDGRGRLKKLTFSGKPC